MDPITLAAAAISFVTPYLLKMGADVAENAADEGGKSVWAWIKSRLTSRVGAEAAVDAERAPTDPANAQALRTALAKALAENPGAADALANLLLKHGVLLSTQTTNIAGSNNKVGQASGGSSVTII